MPNANQRLKLAYRRTLTIATGTALGAIGLGAVFSPPYVPAPYALDERPDTLQVVITPIVIPPKPKPIEAPPSRDFVRDPRAPVEATIDSTLLENPFDVPPPIVPAAPTYSPLPETMPKILHAVIAEYPDLAREMGAYGVVYIEVTVDERGRVIYATVKNSNTVPILEEAALAAARQFLFEPGKQGDQPVTCQIVIPFTFSLE